MIVVDAEMTGTDVSVHGIVSIGAVDFERPERQFYGECQVFSTEHVMEDALAVNGFTLSSITDSSKQAESDLVSTFLTWAGEARDHTVAGHNPHNDLAFIKAAAYRHSINWTLADRLIDLHSVCIAHMLWQGREVPTEKHRSALTSDGVFAYVELPPEPKPHNALNGAKWEAEAFSRLLYGQGLLDQFTGVDEFI